MNDWILAIIIVGVIVMVIVIWIILACVFFRVTDVLCARRSEKMIRVAVLENIVKNHTKVINDTVKKVGAIEQQIVPEIGMNGRSVSFNVLSDSQENHIRSVVVGRNRGVMNDTHHIQRGRRDM